jgi:hypothetical protein
VLRTVAKRLKLTPPSGSAPELITRRAIVLAPSRGGEVVVGRA